MSAIAAARPGPVCARGPDPDPDRGASRRPGRHAVDVRRPAAGPRARARCRCRCGAEPAPPSGPGPATAWPRSFSGSRPVQLSGPRGVSGTRSSAPGPKLSSILRLISSRSMPIAASASASPAGRRIPGAQGTGGARPHCRPSSRSTAAASTPRPPGPGGHSVGRRPARTACVPGRIWSSPRSVALPLARITTFLALSVNRSNIAGVPSGQRMRVRRRAGWLPSARRACFLWTACRDTPRISAISCHDQPCVPCVVDLERLELLQQPAQRGHGPEPGTRVRAVRRGRQGGCVVHDVNLC